MGESSVILKVENLKKVYKDVTALSDISFDVIEGEFFGIIGPSGSGKSTILKIVSCVEAATSGRLIYRGEQLNTSATASRDVVMVWQSLALFPHMNVENNVAFGLSVRGIREMERRNRVSEVLETVGLESYQKRRIHELSGGEQQRVALARALVVRPKVLLLDEPLGALDAALRGHLQVRLLKLHKQTGLTFIMVTHDQNEALALCDRIAIIKNGGVEQVGTPEEIMRSPETPFVASFVGRRNVFEGVVETALKGEYTVRTALGTLRAGRTIAPVEYLTSGSKVAYVIEASSIREGEQGENIVHGDYLGTSIRGSVNVVRLEMPNGIVIVFENLRNERSFLRLEGKITVSWTSKDAYIIPIKA
jgi:ABC-type Fe3+/spermidine/putrescine transport system ATPase subunit